MAFFSSSGPKLRIRSEEVPVEKETSGFDITPFLLSGPSSSSKKRPAVHHTSEASEDDSLETYPESPQQQPAVDHPIEASRDDSLQSGLSASKQQNYHPMDYSSPPVYNPFPQGYELQPIHRVRSRHGSHIGPTDVAQSPRQSSDSASRGPAAPFPQVAHEPPTLLQRCMKALAHVLSLFNFITTSRAIRAPEFCDFDSTPGRIRELCQDILTDQWTRRLPLLQTATPAEVACGQLASVINELSILGKHELKVSGMFFSRTSLGDTCYAE